jgi:hypothetical protein
MSLATLAAEIQKVDNNADMEVLIDLVKVRQKQLKKITQNKAKSMISEGSRVDIRDNSDLGTVTVTAVRRSKCSIETDDGRFFEVPLTMLVL